MRVNTRSGGIPCGPERKNSVAHTVRALPCLALRAYVSVGLRRGFANPAHAVDPDRASRDSSLKQPLFAFRGFAQFFQCLLQLGFPAAAFQRRQQAVGARNHQQG